MLVKYEKRKTTQPFFLKKKRKVVKQTMIVTGRADVSVILKGNMDEINQMVIGFKKIKDIVTTETLIEVEVDLGW